MWRRWNVSDFFPASNLNIHSDIEAHAWETESDLPEIGEYESARSARSRPFPSAKTTRSKISARTVKRPSITIILEDTVRTKPLVAHLVKLGADVTLWNAAGLLIDSDGPPPNTDTLFYCRASPSARLRKKGWTASCTRRLLEWLELDHSATVLNGRRAFALETCKLAQTRALQSSGLGVPRTIVLGGAKSEVETAAGHVLQDVLHVPSSRPPGALLDAWQGWWVKPAHGGSGAGTARYDNIESFVRARKDPESDTSPGNVILVQEETRRPERGRRDKATQNKTQFRNVYYRAEFVDCHLLYILRVNANTTAVSACPCERRTDGSVQFSICRTSLDPWRESGFSLKASKAARGKLIAGMIRILGNVGAIAAAVEFQVTKRHGARIFDLNFNTNYGDHHEKRAGLQSGYRSLAEALVRRWNAEFDPEQNTGVEHVQDEVADREGDRLSPLYEDDSDAGRSKRDASFVRSSRGRSALPSSSSSATEDESSEECDSDLTRDHSIGINLRPRVKVRER